MTTDEYIQTAATLGRLAFEEGRASIPSQDPAMMGLIARNQDKPFGSAIAPLKAWVTAWHRANLAAILPNEEE